MKTRMTLATAAALAALSGAVQAQSVPLAQNQVVRDAFFNYYLSEVITDNCPQLSQRLVRVFNEQRKLISYALGEGYTMEDYKELEDNDAAKDALRAEIRAELQSRGARPGESSGYCKIGREEIARNTAAGRLLKDN